MANSTVGLQMLISFLDPTSGVTPAEQLATNGIVSFAGSEHRYMKGLMTVPVGAGGAIIPTGPVTSPGDFAAINNDPSNFIIIYSGVGGTKIAQLDPGKPCLIPLDPSITAPAAEANTGSCQMQYFFVQRGDVSPEP